MKPINRAFSLARSQAKVKGQHWELTREQYIELWEDKFPLRGLTMDAYCLYRVDLDEGWTYENTVLGTRRIQHEISKPRRYLNNTMIQSLRDELAEAKEELKKYKDK